MMENLDIFSIEARVGVLRMSSPEKVIQRERGAGG